MSGERIIVEKTALAAIAVEWISRTVTEVLRAQARCHLMLAGGGTPLPVYRALSHENLPWDRLTFYFGDERCVPPDHPQSNYRAITEALFPAGLPQGAQLHRMQGEDDPEAAARAYAALLPARIDVLLLGMGEDGHTASLFPGSPALAERQRLVMPVIGSKPPPQRLTITPPVIRSAAHTLVMVAGADKAEMVARALRKGDVPIALASEGDWLLDQGAAAGLASV